MIFFDNVNLHYSDVSFKDRSIKSLISSAIGRKQNLTGSIHALKNLTFEIKKGERVALLGHNGAGKSTLLKTIADLYPISKGKKKVDGEVRSLFDLSLGFEPDATGRENILYRGLLLGLTPSLLKELEGEIIEFSGLGEFIEYPVKTYSAGMQVRLAFSISTAVGGNILLLDEIIGAGDVTFMDKAKKRLASLVEKAEILFLATHDLLAAEEICSRGMVLKKGEIMFDGNIKSAIAYYKQTNILEH